jgi:hypothetical protein
MNILIYKISIIRYLKKASSSDNRKQNKRERNTKEAEIKGTK